MTDPMSEAELQVAIDDLELAMPALRQRHCDLASYTGAWSDRCDAILAATPDPLRRAVERQLDRIGVRWGAVAGARMTSQFPVYVPPK